MIIVIYAAEEASFKESQKKLLNLGYRQEQIVFANSNLNTRLDFIKKYNGQYLFFLDHDCMLTELQSKQLKKILDEKINEGQKNWVVTGLYANANGARPLQKTHNWIANNWLSCSYENNNKFPLLLGGVFLIYSVISAFGDDLEVGEWGAEDKHLAILLSKAQFKFQFNANLQVEHLTKNSFRHFVRRAYKQGINDVKYFTQSSQSSTALCWLRKIDFLDVRLVLLVLLHFLVLISAKSIQKVRQLNK